jgi:hypothetical protein
MFRLRERSAFRIAIVVAMLVGAVVEFFPADSLAATPTFSSVLIRTDRMATNTATTGLVCATSNGASQTAAKVVITFPANFTVNAATNWTVTNAANLSPTGTSSIWPGMGTATNVTGQVVTFPSTGLSATPTTYCFQWSSSAALTTPVTAANSETGSIQTQTSGGTALELTNFALSTYANDQITVSVAVPPSFIFSLASATDTFSGGNLSASNPLATGGDAVTVTTNAKGGFVLWAKDSRQGLYSANVPYTITTTGTAGTVATLIAGHEGYVLDPYITTQATGGCTVAVPAGFGANALPSTYTGGILGASFLPIAQCTGGTPGTANGDVVTLYEIASISGVTPAATDYSDIITTVAAGNF